MVESKLPLRGEDVRIRNEKLILRLIHKNEHLSQSEAVTLTGLKPPTILRIFTNLENEKLIKISKKAVAKSEKKGRRPVFYQINAKAAYAIGVDFCSTSASIVIVDFAREPIYNYFVEFGEEYNGDTIFTLLCKLIEDGITSSGINRKKLLGIGIGAPGRVDIKSGTVIFYDRIKGLTDFHLKESMEEVFDAPIFVNNNCAVIAMNQYIYGIGSESNALITLLIRSGVGGAYINEGKVLTTNGLTTMEVGHISIDQNGNRCECGDLGCLESYIAEPAIFRDLQKIKNISSFHDIDELIEDEDPEVDKFLQEKAKQLSRALIMLNSTLTPDTYLLISRSKPYVEKLSLYTQKYMDADSKRYNRSLITLKNTSYNPINAGQGAADIVFNDYFVS